MPRSSKKRAERKQSTFKPSKKTLENLKNLRLITQEALEFLFFEGDFDFFDEEDRPRPNEAIKQYYQKKGFGKEFKTFKKWLEEGFCVKKGEKALLMWSKPISWQLPNDQELEKAAQEEGKKKNIFRVAFVFSNKQVEKLKSESDKKRT